jgi:hypothetical protein
MENNKNKISYCKLFAYAGALIVLCFVTTPISTADAATLRLSPGAGSFLVGSSFDVSIVLDTKGKPVNLIETELFFPPDKLQLSSPSVGKSIIQLWPAPPIFSNREGRVYFAGGAPDPGLNTSNGLVLTLTFRVVSAGKAEIRFGGRSSLLAHDGKGTNVLTQPSSAFFRLFHPPPLGPAISSPTHPDQEKWYRENNPIFVWSKSAGAEAYSFKINQDPGSVPDTIADGVSSTAAFEGLGNGIWYFHLREKANGVWGGASRYVVKIDNDPPAEFRINVSPSARTSNRSPIFRFFAADVLSGFGTWEMKIMPLFLEPEQALFFGVDSPYRAVNLEPGRYLVVVRAADKAGNLREETETITILWAGSWLFDSDGINLHFVFVPWRYAALVLGLLFLAFLIIVGRLWIEHRHHVKHAFKEDFGKIFGLFKKKNSNEKL